MTKRRVELILLGCILVCLAASQQLMQAQEVGSSRLQRVQSWFYYLSVDLDESVLDQILASTYDLVVIDPVVTEAGNTDFDIAAAVGAIQHSGDGSGHPKLVLAYIDIGQAESYRTYWQPNWRIGDPAWIVGADPDGWEENYPVAYWYDEWRTIWFDGPQAILQTVLDAGFDGVYLDWVEAYSDENVVEFARQDGVNPVEEMVWFVDDIRAFLQDKDPDQIIVAQNAAELVEIEGYAEIIDGLAQEQTWFDGGAEGQFTEGDCPLPETDADVDSPDYYNALPPACRALYDAYPDSTLHMSSEEYLSYLNQAGKLGLVVLTVDYALEPQNIAVVYERSRARGFVPFVSVRSLDRFVPPYSD